MELPEIDNGHESFRWSTLSKGSGDMHLTLQNTDFTALQVFSNLLSRESHDSAAKEMSFSHR